MVDAELFGDIGSPTKKDIEDDSKWETTMTASCGSLNGFFERGFDFERGRSLKKVKDEVIRHDIVFKGPWEAMGGA